MIELKLKEMIDDTQTSRYELAKSMGINYQTLTKLYNGESKSIPYDILDKLCQYFDCTPGDLLIYKPDPAAISPEEFIQEIASSNSKEAAIIRAEIYHRHFADYRHKNKD